MSAALAVARREFSSFFRTPLGWVVIALFACLSGFVFTRSVFSETGSPASLREFFLVWWRLLIIIAPAISMRVLSEEVRSGTIESLLTSPASDYAIVVGKFAAALAFLCACLSPTLVYVAILFSLSDPDPGPIAAGYLGVLLLGAYYLAVGTLISALTSSQTLAFLATLFCLLGLEAAAARLPALVGEPLSSVLAALSSDARITDFARGLIDSSHIVHFAVVSAWFLVLAGAVLESRRWR